MRTTATLLVVLGIALTPRGRCQAGLYSTVESEGVVDRNFSAFRHALIPLYQIGSAETESPLQKRYGLIKDLVLKGLPEKLTAEQRLNLSSYLMRVKLLRPAIPGAEHLFTYRVAADVLKAGLKDDPDNFLLLSNLATAEQLDASISRDPGIQALFLRRAHGNAAKSLSKWPEKWSDLPAAKQEWFGKIGWKPEDYDRFRRAETYQLKLLALRSKEASARKKLPQFFAEDVDALFGDERRPVKFVGESGQYEAGKIAPAERAKLPKDAIEIVQQLFLWMPDDFRLYWLLGELYNAEGDVEAAKTILEEIRSKINPQPKAAKPIKDKDGTTKKETASFEPEDKFTPKLLKQHLQVLREHKAPELKIEETPPKPAGTASKPSKAEPAESATPFPIDLQTFGVGFGAGLLVAILAVWQLREYRRRRLAKETARGLSGPPDSQAIQKL